MTMMMASVQAAVLNGLTIEAVDMQAMSMKLDVKLLRVPAVTMPSRV